MDKQGTPLARGWNNPDWTLEERREMILTNHAASNFAPNVIDCDITFRTALDFGCGIGRNVSQLRNRADTVYGYDQPTMIAAMPENVVPFYDFISSEWRKVLQHDQQFDLAYCCLVLQHMEFEVVTEYMGELLQHSPGCRLLVVSRDWMDGSPGGNVLEALLKSGLMLDKFRRTRCDHWEGMFRR